MYEADEQVIQADLKNSKVQELVWNEKERFVAD